MLSDKQPTVSVVIPARNEADIIEACLLGLRAQTLRPLEVIVVDNGSDDETAEIARRCGATVISETKTGTQMARNAGFNFASGEIIARIDADTIVEPDWLRRLVAPLVRDARLNAVSGPTAFYDVACKRLMRLLLNWFYFVWNDLVCAVTPLFGSNMAIRREAWQAIREPLGRHRSTWEDLDLACQLPATSIQIIDAPAAISMRSARQSPLQAFDYMLNWLRTYLLNRHWRGIAGSGLGLLILGLLAPAVLLIVRIPLSLEISVKRLLGIEDLV